MGQGGGREKGKGKDTGVLWVWGESSKLGGERGGGMTAGDC